MSALLSIDTSTQACSAALLHNGELIQEFSDQPRSHTRLLLPMIDKVLAEAGLSLGQLDAIAYTSGPGSFTGLRIGLGVVQGLAFGANLPVVGISTLQALAMGADRQGLVGQSQLVVPAFDARMGEIYWGVYRAQAGDTPEVVIADSLTAPDAVASELAETENLCGVGEGWQFAEQFPINASFKQIELLPEAQDVARLAEPLVNAGKVVPVEQAELVYLRDTVSWKKRERLRK